MRVVNCGLVVLALCSVARAQEPAKAPAAPICGIVQKVSCKTKPLSATVLELKPKSKGLPITIDAADRHNFRLAPEDLFMGAEICAAGATEVRDGKPRMLLRSLADVTSLKAPARRPQAWIMPAWRECDDAIQMPSLVREVQPAYTGEAMKALIQGRVLMQAVVLPDGTVGEIHVMKSLDATKGLDQQAVGALRQWGFKPGTKAGQPVPVVVEVEMSFRLK